MSGTPSAGWQKFGVISDTHGLLRPGALKALAGCTRILHAGDVGRAEVLERLQAIAPVTAVRGNVDRGEWTQALPVSAVVEAGPAQIYLLHNLDELDLSPTAAGFNVVIFGHSHRPHHESRQGVLYLNPGSLGPRRFHLPVSMAYLHIGPASFNAELVTLEE